jgi:hypothetical protein
MSRFNLSKSLFNSPFETFYNILLFETKTRSVIKYIEDIIILKIENPPQTSTSFYCKKFTSWYFTAPVICLCNLRKENLHVEG